MFKVEIPNIFLASEFPDRNQIKVLSEWKPEYVYIDLEVYYVSERKLITVELPVNLFEYDKETRTLIHLTFPKFYLKCQGDRLTWYISEPNTEEVMTEEFRKCYQFFLDYLCTNNLMSDRFRTNNRLKYLGWHDWHKHPHPNKYYCHFQNETIHCLHHFDSSKYQVRRSNSSDKTLELVDLATDSVFVWYPTDLSYDWINKRYNLCL